MGFMGGCIPTIAQLATKYSELSSKAGGLSYIMCVNMRAFVIPTQMVVQVITHTMFNLKDVVTLTHVVRIIYLDTLTHNCLTLI